MESCSLLIVIFLCVGYRKNITMCDPAPSGQKSSQGQKRPPTRSMERTDERHRQSSEMHRSIERNDFGQMKKLLDWGEHFCTGEGLNCFIFAALMPGAKAGTRWKMVKRMLDLDVSGLTARNAGRYLFCFVAFF